MKRNLIGLCLIALLCVSAFAAASQKGHPAEGPAPIHNGLWWQSKASLFRDGFITGYKSGSAHGAGHTLDINQFPAIELIDGLDSFYKDFRNRNILVDDALTYVQDQLRGFPDDKLNAELLKMRAAAAPAGVE
jgi:hypothetical protein